jgi:hypothetical protein
VGAAGKRDRMDKRISEALIIKTINNKLKLKPENLVA